MKSSKYLPPREITNHRFEISNMQDLKYLKILDNFHY